MKEQRKNAHSGSEKRQLIEGTNCKEHHCRSTPELCHSDSDPAFVLVSLITTRFPRDVFSIIQPVYYHQQVRLGELYIRIIL